MNVEMNQVTAQKIKATGSGSRGGVFMIKRNSGLLIQNSNF